MLVTSRHSGCLRPVIRTCQAFARWVMTTIRMSYQKRMQGKLVADAVETWSKLAENRPTLCYAVDRAHAKALQAKFQEAGIPCGYQDAFTKDKDHRVRKTDEWIEGRESIKKKFHDGEYPVVVNVGTLTTGIDWDVRCISMCRPTKSDMLFVQTVGRGLRTAEGKKDCLILDHSDNHLRLGYVTSVDESYTGLHVGNTPRHDNRTEGIRLPKECPACAYLKPPKMAACPACGFVAKVVSKIKPEAGELVEMTRELKGKPKPPPDPLRVDTMAEKAEFFAELKHYGTRQGYAAGWASHKYKEKTGVWPNHPYIKNVEPSKWIRPETSELYKVALHRARDAQRRRACLALRRSLVGGGEDESPDGDRLMLSIRWRIASIMFSNRTSMTMTLSTR